MIDNIDYSILKCLDTADQVTWKKRIHDHLTEQQDLLPMPGHISLQTTSRRVDTLHTQGLLQSSIISPDELRRSLIIGYRITDHGYRVMEKRRTEILKCIVGKELFCDEGQLELTEDALAEMVTDEFGLDDHTEQTVDHYHRDELLTLLGLYFLGKESEQVRNDAERRKFQEIIREQQEIGAAIRT